MSDIERLREVLAQIAELASSVDEGEDSGEYSEPEAGEEQEDGAAVMTPSPADATCSLRLLPTRLLIRAAEVATQINPVNAPGFGPAAAIGAEIPTEPARLAVLTAKYWGPRSRRLTVSFMESTPADLRRRIVAHLNAWSARGGISFAETMETGDVRISRGPGGYWSYLGTDIRLIPRNRPTMNLQGFTMSTPEAEYRRVVRHEAGHTLGFPHEHMRRQLINRIDRQKAYDYFRRTQGWDRAMVDSQVLTPLNEWSIMGTPSDEDSIMCYQLPGTITKDGKPIRGGKDINATDYNFVARIYPKIAFAPDRWGSLGRTASSDQAYSEDWDESEDPAEVEV
jgi:hypothetical protein